jgi:hypothetical protein
METDNEREANVLFSLKLHNRVSGAEFIATVYYPQKNRFYSSLVNTWCEDLRSKVVLEFDKEKSEEVIAGGSLLEIFWMATDCIRHKIPSENEVDWTNENGTPIWAIIPNTIPIGWGHEFYREIVNSVDAQVKKFVAKIEKRRRNYEAKAKRLKKP